MLFTALSVAASAQADTSDYIWNEQFKKKLTEAETGKKTSQYAVGNMYLKGQGTDINASEAFKWFSKAAEKGHTKSEYKLGFLYLKGKGVKKSTAKAMKWLKRAASKDYGAAHYQIGKMYSLGQGVGRDNGTALVWYTKAEKAGYSPAKRAIANAKSLLGSRSPAKAPAPKPKSPARKPVKVAKNTAPKPSAPARLVKPVSSGNVKGKLLSGLWSANGYPAEMLPSEYNNCTNSGSQVTCTSKQLTESTDDADIDYIVEANIEKFSGDSKFQVSYRRNIMFIMPSDLDDPDAKLPPGLKTGWEKSRRRLTCSFRQNDLISCKNNKGIIYAFSRQ